ERSSPFPKPVEELLEPGPKIVPLHREFQVVREPADLVADVVSTPAVQDAVHRFLLHERADPIRELDFAPPPFSGLPKAGEDLRRQNVPADRREIGAGFLGGGLLGSIFKSNSSGSL